MPTVKYIGSMPDAAILNGPLFGVGESKDMSEEEAAPYRRNWNFEVDGVGPSSDVAGEPPGALPNLPTPEAANTPTVPPGAAPVTTPSPGATPESSPAPVAPAAPEPPSSTPAGEPPVGG